MGASQHANSSYAVEMLLVTDLQGLGNLEKDEGEVGQAARPQAKPGWLTTARDSRGRYSDASSAMSAGDSTTGNLHSSCSVE